MTTFLQLAKWVVPLDKEEWITALHNEHLHISDHILPFKAGLSCLQCALLMRVEHIGLPRLLRFLIGTVTIGYIATKMFLLAGLLLADHKAESGAFISETEELTDILMAPHFVVLFVTLILFSAIFWKLIRKDLETPVIILTGVIAIIGLQLFMNAALLPAGHITGHISTALAKLELAMSVILFLGFTTLPVLKSRREMTI